MTPEEHEAALKVTQALKDGEPAAFALLEAFPHHLDQHPATLVEPMRRFHQFTEERVRWIEDRRSGYAMVALIDGLTKISTGYLDSLAQVQGTTRQALLDNFRTNILARREKTEDE